MDKLYKLIKLVGQEYKEADKHLKIIVGEILDGKRRAIDAINNKL